MKKFLIPTLTLAALLAMPSCKNAQGGTAEGDSLGNDTTLTTGVADQTAASAFLSPDLRLFELKGRVKLVTVESRSCNEKGEYGDDDYVMRNVFVFREDGTLATDAKELDWRLASPKLTRNSDGSIRQVAWRVEEFGTDVTEKYVYDPNGFKTMCVESGVESVDTLHFCYDESGKLLTSSSMGAGEGSVFKSESSYTILEEDTKGNWTRRLSKSSFMDAPDDGKYNFGNEAVEYKLETREIVYY